MTPAQSRYVASLQRRYGRVSVHPLGSGAILASYVMDRFPVTVRVMPNGASRLA
jgi:hypothetical protein